MYIIAEYLFLENLAINYLILHSTKILTKTKIKGFRVFYTAVLSALYPFIIFFPELNFLGNFYMKIIISLILVKLAYNSKNKKLYIKQVSAFYLMSFMFAGTSIGVYFFTNSYYNTLFNPSYVGGKFPIKYVMLGVALGGIILHKVVEYYQEKLAKEKELLETKVHLNNKYVKFISLTDTGNSLVEPLSKTPVFIVEYKVIEEILPKELREIFISKKEEDFFELEKLMDKLVDKIQIRFVPFKSIGSKGGILLGFKPEYITIYEDNRENIYKDVIIGIFNDNLSSDGQYRGLLNKDIFYRRDLIVSEN